MQGMRGRYKVNSPIGTGGLGRVWKATSDDGATVAIKEPLTDGPQEQVTINCDKLRVEAIVLERLTGAQPPLMSKTIQCYDLNRGARAHIVRFLDVDRSNTPTALVIEFVYGKSIDDTFRAPSPDLARIDEYAIRILSIVKSLHEINVLHRDISPHNLIATPDEDTDPVLIDFGTVKERFNQLAITGAQWSQIVKTGYSAPELALGLASPSSDLYSVAATLVFMFTGLNPQYLRDSSGELDEVHKPQLAKVPADRLRVLKKALSYHPADRYQTADDMLSAFAGRLRPLLTPHIVAAGRKVPIKGSITVGKFHQCYDDCRRKGFAGMPDIAINDPENYISRHHARIRVGVNGECYVEDLHAVSGTALRHSSSAVYERLRPEKEYPLHDGDVIALAYSPAKGPYMTVSYHTG